MENTKLKIKGADKGNFIFEGESECGKKVYCQVSDCDLSSIYFEEFETLEFLYNEFEYVYTCFDSKFSKEWSK